MANEADTCRKYVLPKLYAAGWDDDAITEQRYFTDGRIIVSGTKTRRKEGKKADYLLKYTRDYTLAVVEAKPEYKKPADGLGQAKEYAEILGLKFAYSTNGHGIVEFDYHTGLERNIESFPSPKELWARLIAGTPIAKPELAEKFLTPYNREIGPPPRYYQDIAINRAIEAILNGQKRLLLTLATGTGKTTVAAQICWKLWKSKWNAKGVERNPRILYLADRNFLVDKPQAKEFAVFGEARQKISGDAVKSREMYFAIYQGIAEDENRPGLYKEYAPDFFDLIIIDECHRGSAKDESNWKEILEYFKPAFQLGMTATPLREDNRDTYRYFKNPLYIYSLKQGIEDGFLAPYRVHRVVTQLDATGFRPNKGEVDRYGREIPDEEYHTKDFERVIVISQRTKAIARHLTDFMAKTDRFAKTIVFCVDQEHALEMRQALNNYNVDLVQDFPDYVCRVTSDEKEIGMGHLDRFQELETRTPVILTTSQLLTTGLDAPTCKNVVIVRNIESSTEFKQIIGRGTRVRADYDKLFFNIIDYTGAATRKFADPDFDGEPPFISEEQMDENGETTETTIIAEEQGDTEPGLEPDPLPPGPDGPIHRKFYVDGGGEVVIAAHIVYELDADGKQMRVVKFTDYTAEKVRTLFPNAAELRGRWADPDKRKDIIEQLDTAGIDFDELAAAANQPDADPFDLLCHIAFNAPLRTRRERAERMRKDKKDFFDQYGPKAKEILNDLLEKYSTHGTAQFVIPDVLKVPPISTYGNVPEIAVFFGGADKLRGAVNQLQTLLYAAA